MAFFQLRSPPGASWPPLPAPEIAQLWSAYQALDRTQWLSRSEVQELQLTQLRTLLGHCFHNVPYYRRLLSDCSLAGRPIASWEEFRRIKPMTRELFQAHASELKARGLPEGIVEVGSAFTSGTNGVPIQVFKTNRDNLWWSALFLRDLEWCGFDPRGRLASIKLAAMKREDLPRALEGFSFPYWTHFCQPLLETGPAFVMDIRQEPRRQLAWLHTIQPNYLSSLPSNLEFLAGLLEESGEKIPSLRGIQTVGEPLSDAARQRIEAGFGVPIKNVYSSTENGYIASSCPLGHGLHVHSENVVAEVLDADDQPCAPGQSGRLVATNLHSFAVPFVRYDILDEVTLGSEKCPCGRGLPLWTRVEGRRLPLLHLPNGRRKSVLGIVLGVRQVGGVHQFQIVQRACDRVIVRIVPDRTWSPAHAEQIRVMVCDEFESTIRVEVEENQRLERSPGGKLRIAVTELDKAA